MRARERSMRYLRGLGMRVGCTEHFSPHVKIRQDLFGFIDLIALSMDVQRTDGQFVAVQVRLPSPPSQGSRRYEG